MTTISGSKTTAIGDVFHNYGISIQTINIETTLLNSNGTKTRRQHMQELFNSIGGACEKTFLNATVRDDVQRERPQSVRFSDGYVHGTFFKAILPITEKKEEAIEILEKIWNWAFADSSRINKLHLGQELEIPAKLLDNNEEIDQKALQQSLVYCLKSKQGRLACSVSHMRALEEGQTLYEKGKIKAVLITEDDIELIQEPKRFIEIFQNAMKDLKGNDWDIFMLGASSYMPSSKKDNSNAEKVAGSEHLVKVKYAYGNFAYLVNGSSISKLALLINKSISLGKEEKNPIVPQDVKYAEAMENGSLKVFSSLPKLIGCLPCFSDLCGIDMDYKDTLEKEWIFPS